MTSRSAKPARASGSGKKANGLDKRRISKRTSSKHNIVRSKSLKKSYVLERQVGFQLRLAVQRHTAIFVANMVLTPELNSQPSSSSARSAPAHRTILPASLRSMQRRSMVYSIA